MKHRKKKAPLTLKLGAMLAFGAYGFMMFAFVTGDFKEPEKPVGIMVKPVVLVHPTNEPDWYHAPAVAKPSMDDLKPKTRAKLAAYKKSVYKDNHMTEAERSKAIRELFARE